jgi:hypothetical protein
MAAIFRPSATRRQAVRLALVPAADLLAEQLSVELAEPSGSHPGKSAKNGREALSGTPAGMDLGDGFCYKAVRSDFWRARQVMACPVSSAIGP